MATHCRDEYNEVVIKKRVYEAQLPHAIAAVFCVRSRECAQARERHNSFLQTYSLSGEQVPLLYYDYADGFVDIT